MRRLRALLVTVGLVALTVPMTVPAAAAAPLGGYTVRAEATPVRVQVWEPVLPAPTEPQGELAVGFTRATLNTGPASRGLASTLWPGDLLGDGLNAVVPDENAEWPAKASAKYPGGADKASQEATPGSGAYSTAGGTGATARAKFALTAPPGEVAPKGTELLLAAESVSAGSVVDNAGARVTSTAKATATDLELLAGLITLDGVAVTSTSSSDGATGKADGTVRLRGLKVLDQKVALPDDDNDDLPKQPAEVAKLLKQMGITITPVQTARELRGAHAAQSTHALTVTVDTGPLRTALNTPLSAVQELLFQLPPEVQQHVSQLYPLFELKPTLVYVIGDAGSVAEGVPPVGAQPSLPAGPGGSGPVGSPGTPATGDAAGAGSGVPADAEAPASSAAPAGPDPILAAPAAYTFAGIPVGYIAGVILLGAVGGWLLRQFGLHTLLAGFAGCDLGAAGAVPNLREG